MRGQGGDAKAAEASLETLLDCQKLHTHHRDRLRRDLARLTRNSVSARKKTCGNGWRPSDEPARRLLGYESQGVAHFALPPGADGGAAEKSPSSVVSNTPFERNRARPATVTPQCPAKHGGLGGWEWPDSTPMTPSVCWFPAKPSLSHF